MPDLSVVVPVHNERDNILPLLTEIATALRGKADFEIVYVDDLSRDDTLAVLTRAKAQFPELRVLRHVAQSGQSTALRTGIKAARGAGQSKYNNLDRALVGIADLRGVAWLIRRSKRTAVEEL